MCVLVLIMALVNHNLKVSYCRETYFTCNMQTEKEEINKMKSFMMLFFPCVCASSLLTVRRFLQRLTPLFTCELNHAVFCWTHKVMSERVSTNCVHMFGTIFTGADIVKSLLFYVLLLSSFFFFQKNTFNPAFYTFSCQTSICRSELLPRDRIQNRFMKDVNMDTAFKVLVAVE